MKKSLLSLGASALDCTKIQAYTRLSPDEVDSPYTYTSKRDIWHMGVLLVQLLFGYQSLWLYPGLGVLLQHSTLLVLPPTHL